MQGHLRPMRSHCKQVTGSGDCGIPSQVFEQMQKPLSCSSELLSSARRYKHWIILCGILYQIFYVKVYLYLLLVRRAGSLGYYIHSFEPQHESSCPGIVSVCFDRTHVALFVQVKLPWAILRNLGLPEAVPLNGRPSSRTYRMIFL